MAINLEVEQETVNREQLLERAREVGRLAEEHALQADVDAKLPDVVIEKIKEAGFHKLHRPKAYGGQHLDFFTFGDIVRTVANYSVPAAWITYFAIIHETWPAFLPKQGREELYNSGSLMADVFAPVGKVTNDSDGEGYRLSGQWNFCSGVLWCDWIALGAIHQLRDGSEPELSLFIVHKKDAEIIDNWDPIGLRGTGSNAVKLDDVYIPPHYVFPVKRVVGGATAPDGNYEEDYQLFNVPYLVYFLSGFPQIAIGGLERLVNDFEEKTKGRVRIYNKNAKEKDGSSAQRTLGEFKMQLTSLKSIAKEYMEKLSNYEKNGTRVLDEEEREQLFAMRGHISKTAAELGTRILTTLGGNAIYREGHSERFVRDLIAVSAHPSHLYEDAMVGYGKASLGLDGHPMW
ncbi:3-hydroxy-9,10-secoandrosta-1,3,5(10)-triene-9,17-dione monooxygenase [Lentibacillus persicus]|uniref:3-hydroxy-9,10-secoandrosta-1,3,5(10)-triene-9,17-dione monooxygenase n=1 Tax=Lentibacillus persicus TaxID=640948 RepID=A0A1I1YWL2_9BACI|nr:acyl-CoA dehydrogenase family protein [Lentibacillus persicus]SFE23956.1 3-hydroxy-9,10-secoandrosta-1,3,5(10)-triene-9,17-dione monooxygenase [Lentibacillus persicus]